MAIEEKDLLMFLKSYARANSLPLDSSEVYESLADAQAYAQSAIAYAGQTIKVLQNGSYISYVLNPTGDGTKYTLDRVGVTASEVKNYVQVVTALPETGEQGVVYVNTTDNKGYIYTGAAYKVIFEQVDGLENRLVGLSDRLDTIEGTEDGSIKKALEDAKAYADDLKTDIDGDITNINTELDKKANSDDVYTKGEADTAIQQAINDAGHLKREIVDALPELASAKENVIYMVPKADGDYSKDDAQHYTEYMLINGAFEVIGDTAVDLKDYAKTADVTTAIGEAKSELQGKIDTANAAIEKAQTQADKGVADAATAQTAAETAQTAAETAQTTAETAQTTAEAAQKAAENAASGSSEALASAKAELEGKITDAQSAAQKYTDDEIGKVTTAVNGKLDATKVGVSFTDEIPDIKTYIDNQDKAYQEIASNALKERVGDIDTGITVKQYIDDSITESAITITEFE